jgi:hypothetical protein
MNKKSEGFQYDKTANFFFYIILMSIVFIFLVFILDISGFLLFSDGIARIMMYCILLITTIVIIIFSNPFPHLLTKVFVYEESIILKRLKKDFIFKLEDIVEISLIPQYDYKNNLRRVFIAISKQSNFNPPQKKVRRAYFVTTNNFIIATFNLGRLKPFLDNYNKEIINLEKYKDCFSLEDYLYLNNLE